MSEYPTQEVLSAWPNCATPDCAYKACVIMDSKHCSPCSARMGGFTLQQWQEKIRERRIDLGLSVE